MKKYRDRSVSVSALEEFFLCPNRHYLNRTRRNVTPEQESYPLLFGGAIHEHIAAMHKPTKDGRIMFYASKKSAIRAWFYRWHMTLDDAKKRNTILHPNVATEKWCATQGVLCIARYWDAMYRIPRPIQIERKYETRLEKHSARLVGIFDQVRRVSLPYIRLHRPELIVDGHLREDHEPLIILDVKTDRESYDIKDSYIYRNNPDLTPTDEEIARYQFELHESLLPTVYTFLFERVRKKKPIGFSWYHARSGKAFFTFREDEDYVTMHDAIDFYFESLGVGITPKIPGDHCAYCAYLSPCRGRRNLLLAHPEDLFGTSHGLRRIAHTYDTMPHDDQLKLPLRISRVQRRTPIISI